MVDYGNSYFDNRHRIAISAIYAIPFGRNSEGLAGAVFGGWELAPVFTVRTGAPYTIYDETDDNFITTQYVSPKTGDSDFGP